MKMNQIPIVRNSGTTGHKLQGKSVSSIFIYDWNYNTNWPYVVLSRCRTMRGVIMRTKLSLDLSRYSVPPELEAMMGELRGIESVYTDNDFYDEIVES